MKKRNCWTRWTDHWHNHRLVFKSMENTLTQNSLIQDDFASWSPVPQRKMPPSLAVHRPFPFSFFWILGLHWSFLIRSMGIRGSTWCLLCRCSRKDIWIVGGASNLIHISRVVLQKVCRCSQKGHLSYRPDLSLIPISKVVLQKVFGRCYRKSNLSWRWGLNLISMSMVVLQC